ncbi:YceI family protein [Lacinutrix sp. Bg11-31]|uniref:YceI family protein n=1 Tax=Lacinutrix sp. Bg11-31 TaxID=2057808 RepID=UPI000C31669D|nr:YceI family protein [Lacinutrix sp. Bg11-31]AUC80679.1 lipid-binding protein [Lacinutrix sp. Bg11-31]
MKKQVLNILTVLALGLAVVGCKKGTEANTSEAEAAATSESNSVKYVANITESTIEWKGFKPTGTHNGTINLDSGIFSVTDDVLQSGTFIIDMTSINTTDLEGDQKANLDAHLKGTVEGKEGDFFNVAKFPNAAFEITGTAVENGKTMISGNLALKGNKNNITFPATVTNTGDIMTITSDAFTIDRTKWSINYGSKSIFDNLGDKFINDEMELKISITAKKS